MQELKTKVTEMAKDAEDEEGYVFSKDAFKTFCRLLQTYQQERTLQKVREAIVGKDTRG